MRQKPGPVRYFARLNGGRVEGGLSEDQRGMYETLYDRLHVPLGLPEEEGPNNGNPLKPLKDDPAGRWILAHVGATEELADFLQTVLSTSTRSSDELLASRGLLEVRSAVLGDHPEPEAVAALDRLTVKLYYAGERYRAQRS